MGVIVFSKQHAKSESLNKTTSWDGPGVGGCCHFATFCGALKKVL